MPAMAGFRGSVKVNATILRCQRWSLRWHSDQIDVTTFVNAGWASYISAFQDADIELECIYDPADNPYAGVPSLTPGSNVSVLIEFAKNDAVNRFSFPAVTVTEVSSRVSVRDAVTYTVQAKILGYETAGVIKTPGQA